MKLGRDKGGSEQKEDWRLIINFGSVNKKSKMTTIMLCKSGFIIIVPHTETHTDIFKNNS